MYVIHRQLHSDSHQLSVDEVRVVAFCLHLNLNTRLVLFFCILLPINIYIYIWTNPCDVHLR